MVKAVKQKGKGAQAALAPAGGVAKAKQSKKTQKRTAAAVRSPAAAAPAAAGARARPRAARLDHANQKGKRPRDGDAAEQPQAQQREQALAKRHKLFGPGMLAAGQRLEVGRTLVCFDSNILLGHRAEAQRAWEAIAAGGGSRVQALVPLKVRMEILRLTKSSYPGKAGAAAAANTLLRNMMQEVACCRVQREDECFRRHAQPLANQRGDDAILDALLHFHSLGAKVLLATQDKFLRKRITEHGLACVGAGQLVAAVQGALAAAPWSAEHDRKLALLLFAPGYQQAALGVSFANGHSEESYAAFAERLQQPVQTVLLAATRLLAGDAATAAAAASCWNTAAVRRQPALAAPPAAARAGRAAGQASSSVDQGKSGNESPSDAEGTRTPEPPEGSGSAAAAGETGTDDEAAPQQQHAPGAEPQRSMERQAQFEGTLPEPRELRRLMSNVTYREQVLGTKDRVTKMIAQHFGISEVMVQQAVIVANQRRADEKARYQAANAWRQHHQQQQQVVTAALRRPGITVKPKVKLQRGKKAAGKKAAGGKRTKA